MTQRTLVLLKPDAVRRGLVGEIIRRIEAKGYALVALELRPATPELLAEHYAEHEGKPFYPPLRRRSCSPDRSSAIVLEGERLHRGLPLAGRRDRPARWPPRARSAATSVATGAKSSRTSCTAPTPRSRPSARSGSGSPTSDRPRPRVDQRSRHWRPSSQAALPADRQDRRRPRESSRRRRRHRGGRADSARRGVNSQVGPRVLPGRRP